MLQNEHGGAPPRHRLVEEPRSAHEGIDFAVEPRHHRALLVIHGTSFSPFGHDLPTLTKPAFAARSENPPAPWRQGGASASLAPNTSRSGPGCRRSRRAPGDRNREWRAG